jgi:methionine synthase I (cobalamin-dependent)
MFRKLLDSSEKILLDGAMGTELDRLGLPTRCEANLSHPDMVTAIHQDYLKAGSRALITNTLTMNRIFIEKHKLNIPVKDVNLAGARAARKAAGEGGIVLGDISPTGQMLEPFGPVTEKQLTECFKEQAGFLLEGGVDGFIIEPCTTSARPCAR